MNEMTNHFQSVEVDQDMSRSPYNFEDPEIFRRSYNTQMSMSPTAPFADFDPPPRGPPSHFHHPHPQSDAMAPMYYNMYGIDNTGPLSMMDPTYSMVFCQDMVAGNLNDLLLNVFDDNSSVEDSGSGSYSRLTTPNHSPHVGNSMSHFGPQETSGSFTRGLHVTHPINSSVIQGSQGARYAVSPMPAPTILRSVPERISDKPPIKEPTSLKSSSSSLDDGEDILMNNSAAFDSSSMVWKAPDRNTNTSLEGLTTEKSLKPIPARPKIVLSKEVDAIPKVSASTRDRLVSIWSKTVKGPWQDIELVFPTLGFFQDMLESFFMHFHPQYPIIHLPTFDPNTALPHLLGTMIAIGTIWSCGLPVGTIEERQMRAAASGSIGGIGVGLLECSRRAMQHLVRQDNFQCHTSY